MSVPCKLKVPQVVCLTYHLEHPSANFGFERVGCSLILIMPFTLLTAKVIGTATVGLWAGYNLALAETVHPIIPHQLLCCKNKEASVSTFSGVSARKMLVQATKAAAMAGISFVSLLTSYVLANRAGKHPYLLYVSLGAPLVGLLQFYGAVDLKHQIDGSRATSASPNSEVSELSESTYEHIDHPDTEEQLEAQPQLQRKCTIFSQAVAILSTSLFVVNLIGLVGESSTNLFR